MNREELRSLWEQARENVRTLEHCQGPHDFVPMESPPKKFGGRFRCTTCGGEIDAINRRWYEDGLKDGARS